MRTLSLIGCLAAFLLASPLWGQKNKEKATEETKKESHYLDDLSIQGLSFRCIGPALTSGRISDFAVHPDNRAVYYVATSSGGVWKTTNAGTTYEPIFDSQGSYSIGCITMDPNNPNVLWVGTGENNNQRSVAYGDGLYRSKDGGASWEHMGLKNSEHIGKILVDPRNSEVVYVAAIGPLWSAGGDRGLYKTTDGGKNWEAVLTIDEHTGVTDLIMDPRDPDVLYAAAFQRRRHVFTYVGGGQGSTIYKSTDGGANWEKVDKGLPSTDIGRIGLAISPADPEMLYAIVEAAEESGFYKSTNRGASWQKQSGYSTSGNYYSEIVAHPTEPNTVFAMDTWLHATYDGGKSFQMVNEQYKHVDNHCMWIDPDQPDFYLVGCDGGIYESYDKAQTWHFKANLPVTQFYKIEVDNAEPFYHVYGGTQDNFSLGGPTRTRNQHGILNSDWFITNGGDGFESQIDPNDPNIVYAQSQYGGLIRYDKLNGERMGIQPKPRDGEPAYRWNWDAPLAVSAHKKNRIYFAANKLFRSDDRGNTWQVLGDDLTRQIDRNTLEVMGRVQSIDAVAKNASTSPYGTIVAFSESPLNENLLYVGTDDGLIQVSNDGGTSWKKLETFPGVPERTYVNHLLASQHNENTMYALFNNHKNGDFKPYVLKSTDQGNSWTPISNNLPERGSTYALAEDPIDPGLLFVGTEFSCFFTNDGGQYWKKLSNGLPTIAVRDLAIQKRESDLVLGTFGRGIYVLDNYSALRQVKEPDCEAAAAIFPVKPGLLYIPSLPLGIRGNAFQGHSLYAAENPDPGVYVDYFIKEGFESLKSKRQKDEKEKIKNEEPIRYPTYQELEAERQEKTPYLLFVIENSGGEVVRKLKTNLSKGLQRIHWDGRYPSKSPVDLSGPGFDNPFADEDAGVLAMPGSYTVALYKGEGDQMTELVAPVAFELETLGGASLPANDRKALVEFQKKAVELQRTFSGMGELWQEVNNRVRHIKQAIYAIPNPTESLTGPLQKIEDQLYEMQKSVYGDPLAGELDQPTDFSVASRIGYLVWEMWNSTSTPTNTQREALRIASQQLEKELTRLKALVQNDLANLEETLEKAGAPYTPGRMPIMGKN